MVATKLKLIDGNPKVVFNHKLKGPKRDIIIYRHAVSKDGHYVAFSALNKIFLLDVEKAEIINEFDVPKAPSISVEPRFMNNGNLCFIHASELCIYDIRMKKLFTSPMPDKQEECFDMSFHADDTHIAYQSGNYNQAGKITLFNLRDNKIHDFLGIVVPYKYIPGQGMGSKRLSFVKGADEIVCMRKDIGICYYNYLNGNEVKTITYEEMGFRSLIFADDTRFSDDGRYVMVHTEKDMLTKYPEQVQNEKYDFKVNPDADLNFLIYDLQDRKLVFSSDNISMQAAFSAESNLFVHLGFETLNGKYKGFVGIYPIANQ